MADHGEALGVDLNELYVVAHDLMTVANDYTQASNLIWSCGAPTESPLWTAIASEWPMLQSSIGNIVSDTAKNLTDTANALNKTANDYASTDQAAADKFHSMQKQDQQQWDSNKT